VLREASCRKVRRRRISVGMLGDVKSAAPGTPGESVGRERFEQTKGSERVTASE